MDINIETKLNTLVEISKLRFAKILKSISGPKDVTIEPNLIRPLERICGVKWLRLHNVDKIYKFENKTPIHSKPTHIYLISSNLILFKRVIDQIQELIQLNKNKNETMQYHIILTPKVLNSFELLLEELGLYEIITLHSFAWEFIQIDSKLLSLEIPSLFAETYVNGDLSLLPSIGYSLRTLFCVTGRPKITVSVGQHANSVLKHLDTYTDNLGVPQKEDSDFEVFIIMDRSVDYPSTLLTSATYAGLLSDVFKVRCGGVDIKQETEATNTNFLFTMDSLNDPVYADIKNRHISEVSEILSNQAKQLKTEGAAPKDMDISEIKTYVQTKLQKVTTKSKFLSKHLEACERIISVFGNKFEKLKNTEQALVENANKQNNIRSIEDLFLIDEYISLKLMCLMSLTQKLTSDEFHNLKLQYLHKAGYKYLYMFENLITCGLLTEPTKTKLPTLNINLTNTTKRDFYTVGSKLKLIPQNGEVNVRAPTCASYVFGGCYIPIIAQIVTFLTQTQTDNDIKSKLDILNGCCTTSGITKPFPLQRRSIFVCVIGGVSFAEVAALDLVEKLCNCKVVVCSNCVISGNDLIDANK